MRGNIVETVITRTRISMQSAFFFFWVILDNAFQETLFVSCNEDFKGETFILYCFAFCIFQRFFILKTIFIIFGSFYLFKCKFLRLTSTTYSVCDMRGAVPIARISTTPARLPFQCNQINYYLPCEG